MKHMKGVGRGARHFVRDVHVDLAAELLRRGEATNAVAAEFTAVGHDPAVARETVRIARERIAHERARSTTA